MNVVYAESFFEGITTSGSAIPLILASGLISKSRDKSGSDTGAIQELTI